MEDLVEEILSDVDDIFYYDIETTNAYAVPARDDSGLTFPYYENKKGKIIETCVLFVDIRNSTRLSSHFAKEKELLGKYYSSFIHSMVSIADEFGYVRNIIGDRIMVVFEPANCIENALKCAILMNTVHQKLKNKYYQKFLFRIGIGIDFGEMLVLKTGIQKRNEEKSEYKGLVWIGNTANLASKLTDLSSKNISDNLISVTYEETKTISDLFQPQNPLDVLLNKYSNNPPIYRLLPSVKTENVNTTQFLEKIKIEENAVTFEGKQIKNLSKDYKSISTPTILISPNAYRKYRLEKVKIDFSGAIDRIEIKNGLFDYVYGGNLFFSEFLRDKK